jgi:hypothetical protein
MAQMDAETRLEIAACYAAWLIVAAGGPILGEINATCGDDLRA